MNEITGIGDAGLLEMHRQAFGEPTPRCFAPTTKATPNEIKPNQVNYKFDADENMTLELDWLNDHGHGILSSSGNGVYLTEAELDWLIQVLPLIKENIKHE